MDLEPEGIVSPDTDIVIGNDSDGGGRGNHESGDGRRGGSSIPSVHKAGTRGGGAQRNGEGKGVDGSGGSSCVDAASDGPEWP